jgi:hypothetical protein
MPHGRNADSVRMATSKKTATARSRSVSRSAALALAFSERREAPRLKLPKVEAEIVSLGQRATVLDVSFGGMSILGDYEFQVGEIHELRAGTSNRDAAPLRARVRHCRQEEGAGKPRYVTGLEFLDQWCPGDGSAVDEFISQVTRGIFKAS